MSTLSWRFQTPGAGRRGRLGCVGALSAVSDLAVALAARGGGNSGGGGDTGAGGPGNPGNPSNPTVGWSNPSRPPALDSTGRGNAVMGWPQRFTAGDQIVLRRHTSGR